MKKGDKVEILVGTLRGEKAEVTEVNGNIVSCICLGLRVTIEVDKVSKIN